jgi:hypothetical protein
MTACIRAFLLRLIFASDVNTAPGFAGGIGDAVDEMEDMAGVVCVAGGDCTGVGIASEWWSVSDTVAEDKAEV